MNQIVAENNSVELVFENCECITISLRAVESLCMITRGERYVYTKPWREMMHCKEVDNFEIIIDLNDKSCFYHSTPMQTLTHAMTESVLTDRNNCVERLKTCNDITHIYINGICYQMPWSTDEDEPCVNLFQTINEEVVNGKTLLTISIKAEEIQHVN